MSDKTCGTCRHAKRLPPGSPYPPQFLECGNMPVESTTMTHEYYRMFEAFLTDGEMIVRSDFGCILWEAKNDAATS